MNGRSRQDRRGRPGTSGHRPDDPGRGYNAPETCGASFKPARSQSDCLEIWPGREKPFVHVANCQGSGADGGGIERGVQAGPAKPAKDTGNMPEHKTPKKARKLSEKQKEEVESWRETAYNLGLSRKKTHKGISPDALLERKRIIEDALIEAVLDFNPQKGAAFRTYLFRKIHWRILDQNKKQRIKTISFTDYEAED